MTLIMMIDSSCIYDRGHTIKDPEESFLTRRVMGLITSVIATVGTAVRWAYVCTPMLVFLLPALSARLLKVDASSFPCKP